MTTIGRVALALAVLAPLGVGCAHHVDAPAPAAVTASSPATPPAPPVWPDAAPAPDTAGSTPGSDPAPTFSTRAELPDVHFATGQVHADRDGRKALDAAAAWLKAHQEQLVILEGYTDAAGPRLANLALAQRRAKWVMDYLVARGVAASRVTVVSRGEDGALCANRSTACQGQNRRVHFLVRDTGSAQVTAAPSR
jgi:outer membrane protein OmpA-like peptidoglycan-associated protein